MRNVLVFRRVRTVGAEEFAPRVLDAPTLEPEDASAPVPPAHATDESGPRLVRSTPPVEELSDVAEVETALQAWAEAMGDAMRDRR